MLEHIWKKALRAKRLSIWTPLILCLWIVSLLFRIAVRIRNVRSKSEPPVGVPVISVGNITMGGTGKTTIVELLADRLLDDGYRVGLASSGYGRVNPDESFVEPGYRVQRMNASATGDEVMMLALSLPQAVFSVDRSKAQAARALANIGEVDLIIVDDGFQHLKLHRDIDIVTYDAAVDKSHLKAFPLGVLREPRSALSRADVVIITRSNFARDISALRQSLASDGPGAEHFHAQFVPSQLIGANQRRQLKYLEDKSVLAFAGIGNFEPFRRQVDALAGDLDYALEMSDHQEYDLKTLNRIKQIADKHDSDVIVTTGKDWVKLGDFDFQREICYLSQSVDLDPGEERLIEYVVKNLSLSRGN